MKRLLLLPLIALLSALAAPVMPAAAEQTGPTPFPDVKDQAAWPGKGPLKVYPYMTDNRIAFWAKRAASKNAVVFVGDSQIGGWKQVNPATTSFPSTRLVVNRGIGGDTSRGVLWRLQEDVLDLQPTALVLLVGGNDLSAHGPTDLTIGNITAILDATEKAVPGIPVILCNLPPRNAPAAPIKQSELTKLNGQLADLAATRNNVTLFDSFSLFALPDGMPDPQYFAKDLIHLSAAGYEKMTAAMAKVFEEKGIGK
ncbi:hypothetical protein DB346_17105 [Verrucomicrobia bacterium LW23]|nr:hypothetical protein DB346_17105 [Verrucomicrobia bacterium LW23]